METDEKERSESVSRRDKFARGGRRFGVAFVLVVAVAFVAASLYQITASVFDIGLGQRKEPSPLCVDNIRDLQRALDDASAKALQNHDPNALSQIFEKTLQSTWMDADRAEKTCAETPSGSEAFAALLRLRRAHEALLLHQTNGIAPLQERLEAQLHAH